MVLSHPCPVPTNPDPGGQRIPHLLPQLTWASLEASPRSRTLSKAGTGGERLSLSFLASSSQLRIFKAEQTSTKHPSYPQDQLLNMTLLEGSIGVEDLVLLEPLEEESMLKNLQLRYENKEIYVSTCGCPDGGDQRVHMLPFLPLFLSFIFFPDYRPTLGTC